MQWVCQKILGQIPLILFFFNEELYMFEKYQRAILGPSSPDSVAIFEKKLGKTFY